MAASSQAPAAPGSIADTAARLEVWAQHAPRGLARVRFDSEFARLAVVRLLADRLGVEEIPVHEIALPPRRSPAETVRTLIDRLSGLEPGVASISGFATAFPVDGLVDFLRVLNFSRERLADFPLRQIWWLPDGLLDAFLRVAPDLNSWFLVRLDLDEDVPPEGPDTARFETSNDDRPRIGSAEDASRQATARLDRVRNAIAAQAAPGAILALAASAAQAIRDVQPPRRVRELGDELFALVSPIIETTGLVEATDLAIVLDLAMLFQFLDRWSAAAAAYARALELSRESGDRAGEGQTLNNLGNVYLSQRRWAEAFAAFEAVLAIRRASGDRVGESQTLNNLGIVYQSQGRWAEAIDTFQAALAIRREFGNRVGEDHTLNNLGGVYQSQGRWAEAIDTFQAALAIRREFGNRVGEGHTLNNLGVVYQCQGRLAEAIVAFEADLAICRESGDRLGEGLTLGNLALLWEAQGKTTEAVSFARQAVAALEATEAVDALQEARGTLARLEAGEGDGPRMETRARKGRGKGTTRR